MQLRSLCAVPLTLIALLGSPLALAHSGAGLADGFVHMLEIPALTTVTGYMVGLSLSTGLLMMLGLILRQMVVTRKPHSHSSTTL